MKQPHVRCMVHGSFRRDFDAIQRTCKIFREAGIEVLAPKESEITSWQNGFAKLQGEEEVDPRLVELLYLHNLTRLDDGFSYFVNPEGYVGASASYELGITQVMNAACFFLEPPADYPVYLHSNSIWKPEDLTTFIEQNHRIPEPRIQKNEREIHRLWEKLMVPGSMVAVGGIVELESQKKDKEILLVRTHKWGGRFSLVGGKVRRGERMVDALRREIQEETGLKGSIGSHLCTFDQIKHSGYYLSGVHHVFVDHVVNVPSRRVQLNEEAEEFVWMPAKQALKELPIEPNARHTVELYFRVSGV